MHHAMQSTTLLMNIQHVGVFDNWDAFCHVCLYMIICTHMWELWRPFIAVHMIPPDRASHSLYIRSDF